MACGQTDAFITAAHSAIFDECGGVQDHRIAASERRGRGEAKTRSVSLRRRLDAMGRSNSIRNRLRCVAERLPHPDLCFQVAGNDHTQKGCDDGDPPKPLVFHQKSLRGTRHLPNGLVSICRVSGRPAAGPIAYKLPTSNVPGCSAARHIRSGESSATYNTYDQNFRNGWKKPPIPPGRHRAPSVKKVHRSDGPSVRQRRSAG